MPSLIGDAFVRAARDRPHHIGIRGMSDGSTRTLSEIVDEARAIDTALRSHNIPARACLISNVGNHPAFVALLLACLNRATPLVLLDGGLTSAEVRAVADRYQASGVVVSDVDDRHASSVVTPLAGGLGIATMGREEVPSWLPSEACVLKLTSGSSSGPKAVITPERSLLADGRHVIEAMAIGPDDVSLGVIPLSHSYGLGNLVMPLLLQGSTIALRNAFAARLLMSDLDAARVTTLPGVPFMFDYVQRHEPAPSPISRVRLLVTAGAPIDANTVRYFKETLGKKVHALYGTSETGSITFDDSDDLEDPGTVGRPVPETEVTLLDSPAAGPGEGRVHVKGTALGQDYVETTGPGATVSEFTGGGFLTGDLGRMSARGDLLLSGRISPFVNIAGRKVHPEEIERVLRELAGVADASVFGMPDPVRGERLVAWVRRAEPSLDAAALRAACAMRLAPHKIPRSMVLTDETPANSRGKVSRREVEELVRQAIDRGES
jgi:long-chain acyl-CoA synthetase